jgi:hypothetical protein
MLARALQHGQFGWAHQGLTPKFHLNHAATKSLVSGKALAKIDSLMRTLVGLIQGEAAGNLFGCNVQSMRPVLGERHPGHWVHR